MKQFVICLAVIVSMMIIPINEAFAKDQSVYNSNANISFYGDHSDSDNGGGDTEGNDINTLPQTGDQVSSPIYMLYGLLFIILSFLLVRRRAYHK